MPSVCSAGRRPSSWRIRYEPTTQRVYAGGTQGRLWEFDASDPTSLALRSVWNSPYVGETQDCRIYDFGSGPRVLFAKNNEGFAILDPDD